MLSPIPLPQVLARRAAVAADVQALAAAQAAVLAAAEPLFHATQQQQNQEQQQKQQQAPRQGTAPGATSSSADNEERYESLRAELDKAYLAACRCAEWREMVQVRRRSPAVTEQRAYDSLLVVLTVTLTVPAE